MLTSLLLPTTVTLLYDMYMLCKNSRYNHRFGLTSLQEKLTEYTEIVSYVISEVRLLCVQRAICSTCRGHVIHTNPIDHPPPPLPFCIAHPPPPTSPQETLDEAKLAYHIQQGDNNYSPRSNDHSRYGVRVCVCVCV